MKLDGRIIFAVLLLLAVHPGCKPTGVDEPAVEEQPEKQPDDKNPDDKKPDEVKPAVGATVYGKVSAADKGLAGVLVSDGVEICVTDSDGVYQMKSSKKHGYVFVILPSGYKAQSKGVFPQIYALLTKNAATAERVDFTLSAENGQDNYEMIVLGDMQLADRSDDIAQFYRFVTEMKSYVQKNAGKKIYALTLGDMSWDTHWNKYNLTNYVKDINRLGNGIQVFHAIGNHDHEAESVGEMNASAMYKKTISPTFYSFNIGRVHYVMLDSVYSTNDGSGETSYEDKIDTDQIEWLKKDLSYVTKDTPLFVVLHTPIYKDSGKNSLKNADELVNILKAYDKVLVQSGHTHILYNVDKTADNHIMEQNSAAICATWWYTGYDVPWLHIGRDGSPGGYRICSVNGKDISWVYKGIEKPVDYQFRSYDRNSICLTSAKYTPDANSDYKKKFEESWGEYGTASSSNYVYLNIWDYDPSWKIEVRENGKDLKVTQFEGYDPLHVIAYNAKRANINKSLSFPTKSTKHMFKVQASSASSTLEITVTDRFGREYKETMTRPKAFTLEEYMK